MAGATSWAFLCVLLVVLACLPHDTDAFPRSQQDLLLHRMRALSRSPARQGATVRRPVQQQSHGGLPMYMMQLYRTLLAEDRAAASPHHRHTSSAASRPKSEENPRLHQSDSVVSLVAESKFIYLLQLNSGVLFGMC